MSSRFTSRLGLQTPSFTYPDGHDIFESTASQAKAAEAAGFDSFWVMDHFYQLPGIGAPDEPMLECYTVLAGIASRTSTIQLGAMVGGVTYRNPAFLAKTVTTLDHVGQAAQGTMKIHALTPPDRVQRAQLDGNRWHGQLFRCGGRGHAEGTAWTTRHSSYFS